MIYITGLCFIRYALCKVALAGIMEYSAGNKENKSGELYKAPVPLFHSAIFLHRCPTDTVFLWIPFGGTATVCPSVCITFQ